MSKRLIKNKKARRRIMKKAGLKKCLASIVTTNTTNPNTKLKLSNRPSGR
jgi:hypothetical protein